MNDMSEATAERFRKARLSLERFLRMLDLVRKYQPKPMPQPARTRPGDWRRG